MRCNFMNGKNYSICMESLLYIGFEANERATDNLVLQHIKKVNMFNSVSIFLQTLYSDLGAGWNSDVRRFHTGRSKIQEGSRSAVILNVTTLPEFASIETGQRFVCLYKE